jgi:DNA-binding NtrC family response regulator
MAVQTTARVEETDCERTGEAPWRFVALHGDTVGDGLLQDGMVLGRSPQCPLLIDSHGVSREHAQISRQGPLWVIRDLNSTNGTYVQGRRAQHVPVQLGSVVRIGDNVLLVTQAAVKRSGVLQLATGLLAGPELAALLEPLRCVAPTDLPVVVTGATGTGKERVARAVHEWSGRTGPFHAINCAAIPPNMAEAELFGYRKGAFTGANIAHEGHLRSAHGGTLFLDEVAELPLDVQAKLLRALEERSVTPLGESRPLPAAFRVLCATQTTLDQNVATGKFREDLAARLSGMAVHLPPLKERRADIICLFRYFLERETHGHPPAIDGKVVEALCLYSWPKNVRELELLTKRLVALHGAGSSLKRTHLPAELTKLAVELAGDEPLFANREEQDLHRVVLALRDSGGNVKEAAKQAGISRQRVYRLLAGRDMDALIKNATPPADKKPAP